jgi:iron complex transport system ATP-binding protein
LDYRLARLLATEVIEEKPFDEISDSAFARALAQVHNCKTVIDAGVDIGSCNQRMQALLDEAERQGKLQRGYWH